MTGWMAGAALLAVGLALVAPLAASAEDAAFSFRHDLGALLEGQVAGECRHGGLFLPDPPPVLSFENATGVLRMADIHVTERWAASAGGAPIFLDRQVRHHQTNATLRAGPLTISPGAQAQFGVLGGERFHARIEASSLRTEPPLQVHPMGRIWTPSDAGWVESRFAVPDWAQRVEFVGGHLDAKGPMTVWIAGASISSGDAAYDIGPYEERDTTGTGALQETRTTHRYAVLELSEASLLLGSADVRPVCGELALDVDGNATFHRSSGRGPAVGAFEGRELTLEGRFHLDENVDGSGGGEAQTAVAGDVRFAGLDHATVPVAPSSGPLPTAAVAVAGLGLLVALWKLGTLLFTRLARDELLELDARRRIQEVIAARPGATRPELVQASEEKLSTVRYHLRILQAHGRIRSFKWRGRWRYAPAGEDVRLITARLHHADSRTQALVNRIPEEGLPASRLVGILRAEWGLSRSGIWRLIRRAGAEGLILGERHGREVLLRRAH